MTQSELKELKAIGAELGAAKAEVERLREALQAMLDECDPMNLNCGEPWCRARAALLPRSEPCGGCGNDDESKRCIGCGHQFTPAPTDTYTAVDMATAAAQGFRDGQAAVEQAAAQDEAELSAEEILMLFERNGFHIEAGASYSAKGQIAQLLNAAGELLRRNDTRPAQTEQQPVVIPPMVEFDDMVNRLFELDADARKYCARHWLLSMWKATLNRVCELNAAPIAQTAQGDDQ